MTDTRTPRAGAPPHRSDAPSVSHLGRLRSLASGVGNILFPPACALCRGPHVPDADGIVCPGCMVRLVSLTQPRCDRCGHPRLSLVLPTPIPREPGTGAPPSLSPCRWCERLPPFVRAVRSACRMDEGLGGALVHALKYGGWPAVSVPMARRMARLGFPSDVVSERAALVPLPLSVSRQRERGYNQAEVLADALAPLLRLPVWADVLTRTRATRSQVRLTPSERATNVARAFAVRPASAARLHGAHLLLVDDVITTGASLNAAAVALIEGGARIISYITFGRAPDPGERAAPTLDLDPD